MILDAHNLPAQDHLSSHLPGFMLSHFQSHLHPRGDHYRSDSSFLPGHIMYAICPFYFKYDVNYNTFIYQNYVQQNDDPNSKIHTYSYHNA